MKTEHCCQLIILDKSLTINKALKSALAEVEPTAPGRTPLLQCFSPLWPDSKLVMYVDIFIIKSTTKSVLPLIVL